jgi:hypothetical protein
LGYSISSPKPAFRFCFRETQKVRKTELANSSKPTDRGKERERERERETILSSWGELAVAKIEREDGGLNWVLGFWGKLFIWVRMATMPLVRIGVL